MQQGLLKSTDHVHQKLDLRLAAPGVVGWLLPRLVSLCSRASVPTSELVEALQDQLESELEL